MGWGGVWEGWKCEGWEVVGGVGGGGGGWDIS